MHCWGKDFISAIIATKDSLLSGVLKTVTIKWVVIMRGKKLFLSVFIVVLIHFFVPVNAQKFNPGDNTGRALIDSLAKAGLIRDTVIRKYNVTLSKDEAVKFLQRNLHPLIWKNQHDPFRTALMQVVFESTHAPYDSTEQYLKGYPFDSLSIPRDAFYIWEPVRVRIPQSLNGSDTSKTVHVADTVKADSAALKAGFQTVLQAGNMKDTTVMIAVDTLKEVPLTAARFPFRSYRYPYQSDSLRTAVGVLLNYLSLRDSSVIYVTGSSGHKTPMWLNSKSDIMIRYWLRNELNDSVTVWVGSPSRNTIGLYLENGVVFKRPSMQGNISKARVDVEKMDRTKLLSIHKIVTKTQYWKYHTEASAALSQGYLSNWVKGGESSVSTSIDVTAYGDYDNKPMLLSSNNYIRLKYGLVATPTDGIRKNVDLLETNSKINHKAFGRFDFSWIMLFKTQVSKGYNYPNDSIPVSKFMNPASFTMGFGLDYKPNKTTSINFSPLSYKLTICTDTARIDQTLYGIPKDRKSLQEPGMSFVVANEFKPVKNMSITNRLQLFTNYIHNPQNIDVDWEMILTANLNWFTDIRLDTHLIYDDDTKTIVYDRENKPEVRPDGTTRKTARAQFKEFLGLSFVFRF